MGSEIHSGPIRRDAIERTGASKNMAVTTPIRLVQERQERIGLPELLPNRSREILTPMNGRPGHGRSSRVTRLDVEHRRHAETVRNSGGSLPGLLNDIPDRSEIEAGKLEPAAQDFDPRALLDDFAALSSHKRGSNLSVPSPQNCRPICAAIPAAFAGSTPSWAHRPMWVGNACGGRPSRWKRSPGMDD